MSAAGLAQGPKFAAQRHIISAHADYRRTDFVFARTQSHTMRDTPWGRRLKPIRPWGELSGYAAAICVGTILATALI